MITFNAISVPPESKEYVAEVMSTGDIGQNSRFINRFEEMVADYVGAEYCIATSSGTMADAIAVAALKVKYNPKRVIVPALTFIAQPNAVYYNQLPIEFVDVNDNFTMDWDEAAHFDFESSLYFPSDCLGRIANDHFGSERVIEDACEAFGSKLGRVKAGRFGELGTFSFFVSHTITTGEGGAIVTNSLELANLCRSIRSHGRASDSDSFKKFSFPYLGFNGKLTAPQAAIGCGVMKHIGEYIHARHLNYTGFQAQLGGFPERDNEYIIAHGFPVEFRSEGERDAAMGELLKADIDCRKLFSCIPTMERAYAYKSWGKFPNAEWIARTHLYVPCHQNLTVTEWNQIYNAVFSLKGRVNHIESVPARAGA